jgi:cobalt-zinc-cadmium efflux system outer membrane protein
MTPLEIGRPTKVAVLLLLGSLTAGCAARSSHGRGVGDDPLGARAGQASRTPLAAGPELPEGVSLSDGLSEDEAVAVALWRSAGLEAALAELGLAKGDLVQAGLLRNPVFSILLPLGPRQLEFTASWPIEAVRRATRRAGAPSDLARAAQRLVESGLDLVRDVRLAYADALLAEERARLAEDSRDVRLGISAIAPTQLRAGEISQLEAAFVRVDAERAREEAARTARLAQSSRERLLSLLRLAGDTPLVMAPSADARPRLPGLEALLEEALAARPEMRAAELGIEAAGRRAGIARSEILALSAVLDATARGQEGPSKGLARVRAALEAEAQRYVATREKIALEVRQERAALVRARAALDVWEARVVPELERSLARAEEARNAGDASPLEALAARRSLLAARLLEAEARAAERRAEAALGHGLGRSLERAPAPRSRPGR